MFLSLLLTTDPTVFDNPAAKWIGGIVLLLFASYSTLEKLYDRLFGGEKAAFRAWQAKVEADIASFMPQNDIKDEINKLGRQIGDNEGKIKTQHDRTEDAINALNGRTSTLEQHNVGLTLLPGEVSNLKTDHRVLASKVDTLTNSVEKLSQKQDGHFRDLMTAVERLAYTRGELHGGKGREA